MSDSPSKPLAVAMSGGVDSSVAAALLAASGRRVIGFTLRLGRADAGWEASRSCCGLAEVHDARRVADRLGIDHYVLDLTDAFERRVIADFVDEYARGRTPNPCVRCNQHVKFATLLDHARAFGCEQVATGHYARIDFSPDGRWRLGRGADPGKDQSYVLWPLTQEQLAATLLPLGGLAKAEVRRLAGELGFANADKPDSQDLCFVETTPAAFVAARRADADRPGDIVDVAGRRLGTHRGLAHYTVGQRKGLGLASPEPLFVHEIRATDNTLVVADAASASRSSFEVEEFVWVSRQPSSDWVEASVAVRYKMVSVPARFRDLGDGRAAVELSEPLRGIAPGQSAVFYGDDWVSAGGIIAGGASRGGR